MTQIRPTTPEKRLSQQIKELKDLIENRSLADIVCIQEENIEKVLESQRAVQEGQDLMKRSQDRMFQLIENLATHVDNSDKRFQVYENFMVEKKHTNGFRDKQVDDVVNCLGKKVNEDEMERRFRGIEDDLKEIKNMVKDMQKDKDEDQKSNIKALIGIIATLITGAFALFLSKIIS